MVGPSRRGKAVATSSEPEFVLGFPEDYKYTNLKPCDPFKYKDVHLDVNAKNLPVEPHPWLQFPGVTDHERTYYLNKLQEIWYDHVMQPKVVSWSDFAKTGIAEELKNMMLCNYRNGNGQIKSYKIWLEIFDYHHAPIRVWCLEFLSTLCVDTRLTRNEFNTKKVIHFRAGGIQRHCSMPEIVYLTGMMDDDDLDDIDGYDFLCNRVFDKKISGFDDDKSLQAYWERDWGSWIVADVYM